MSVRQYDATSAPEKRDFFLGAPIRFRRRMSGGNYHAEIDGLRFFAIAIVIVGHVAERAVRFFPVVRQSLDDYPLFDWLQRPGLGVALFFSISGYIIAKQARKSPHPPLSAAFLKSYFGRRILRIEPPYFILLLCTWLVLTTTGYVPEGANHFFAEPQSLTVSLWASLFYMHDLIWGAFPRLFPPGWSLEVEVQFYILAPVLFWLWFGFSNVLTRTVGALVALIGSALVSAFLPDHLGPISVAMSILRYFPFFWVGILLAELQPWLSARLANTPALWASALGWIGLTTFLLSPVAPYPPMATFVFKLAACASLIAMFASAWAPKSGFRAFCSWPWISLIGGACYSIYLVHLQTSQVLSALAGRLFPAANVWGVLPIMAIEAFLMIAIGLAFYIVVERTFMLPDWHVKTLQRLRAIFAARRKIRPTPAP